MKLTDLFEINLTNYTSIFSYIKSSYSPERKDIIETLVDSLINLPNRSELTATLINQLAKEDILFKLNIVKKLSELEISNEEELVCLGICLNYLEFKDEEFFDEFLQKYFSDWSDFLNFIKYSKFEIRNTNNDLKINQEKLNEQSDSILFSEQSYNLINWNTLNIKKELSLNNKSDIYTTLFRIIIENTKCNPQECYKQILTLANQSNLLSLAKAFDQISVQELHLVFLLAEIKDFLKIFLKNCPDKRVLCFLFENFYNKNGSRTDEIEEVYLFKKLIDESVWEYFTIFSLKEDLEEFFETTLSEEKINNETEEFFLSLANNLITKDKSFFTQFCMNSNQSITHFLINLERFSFLFDLSEEEQFYFAESLVEVFDKKRFFLSVIVNKIVKFNIINESVYKKVICDLNKE